MNTPLPSGRPLGVAAIGYAFMGKAHSNAWRNVASFFDVPAFEQKVLVGRDASAVSEAAAKYGWAESATDWRSVIARDDIDIVDICAPGWMHASRASPRPCSKCAARASAIRNWNGAEPVTGLPTDDRGMAIGIDGRPGRHKHVMKP